MTFLYDNPEVDYSELSVLTNAEQGDSLSGENVRIDKEEKVLMSEAAGEIHVEQKHGSREHHFDEYDEQFKMVFAVNISLNMGTGKIAAQVAHACLGLYNKLLQKNEAAVDVWLSEGEKKIVLKAVDHVHLKELQKKGESHELISYLVQDAGRTQIPAGSCTVLALFGDIATVDEVTGNLSLL
ncbi:probable peptidyl-tRNA hydrolase 2 isoform X2 [Agrilus planipennis]|nr:probable peptidyl-tRNA hydrolase 2 isoform X2 [Agrilus planipennis]